VSLPGSSTRVQDLPIICAFIVHQILTIFHAVRPENFSWQRGDIRSRTDDMLSGCFLVLVAGKSFTLSFNLIYTECESSQGWRGCFS